MVPERYPPQQLKTETVIATQRSLGASKMRQEKIAETVAANSNSAVTKQFAEAVARSNSLMAEDILRESNYMLPQSAEVRELLEAMLENASPDFPKDAAELLLSKLQKAV